MRWTYIILAGLALTTFFGSALFGGCEETLEVCPPCGSIEDGRSEIVGEYRIDTTFAAVQELKRWAEDARTRTDLAVAELSAVFDAAPDADETEVSALLRAVQAFVSSDEISAFGGSVRYGRCAANRASATEVQNRCEDQTCNIDRPSSRGLCRGDWSGTCTAPADGVCFKPVDAEICDGICTGSCNTTDGVTCPGTCLGVCEGICLAHNEDGRCQGVCDGTCVGTCATDLSLSCDGECTGDCGVDAASACGEDESFFGECNDIEEFGSCTGQFYPEGCGDQCGGCGDTAQDCREVAKFVAWTRLYCGPADVSVNAATATVDPLSDGALKKLLALERALAPVATDYARLSLLLEGYDLRTGRELADAFSPGQDTIIDKSASKYFEYGKLDPEEIPPVDVSRGFLPVEALKARVHWLQRTAVNSDGGFRITAGTFDCLSPALAASADIMGKLVPVNAVEDADTTRYTADLTCATVSSDENTEIPCLYNLLDTQEALLTLLDLQPEPGVVR